MSTKTIPNSLKRFLTIYTLRTLLSLIPHLINRKVSLINTLLNPSILRFSLSLSLPAPIYRIARSHTSPFVAGCLASMPLSIASGRLKETICQSILVRTVYYLICAWVYNPTEQTQSKPTPIRKFIKSNGAFTTWTCLATSVCHGCFVTPNLVSKRFFAALVEVTKSKGRLGKQADTVIRGMAGMNQVLAGSTHKHPIEIIPAHMSTASHIDTWTYLSKHTPLERPLAAVSLVKPKLGSIHHDRFVCAIQHPQTSSCLANILTTGVDVFKGVVGTYIVLNMGSMVYSEGKRWYLMKFGMHSRHDDTDRQVERNVVRWGWRVVRAMEAAIRSTMMVTLFVSSFSGFLCLFRRIFGRERLFAYGLSGALAASAIFVDKAGRLVELNTFLAGKVVESCIIFGGKRGVRCTPFVEAVVMMPCVGVLTTLMERNGYAVSGLMAPVFHYIFGIN